MTAVELAHEQHGGGDAPAVLLGGSLGTTRAMWAPQIPALAVERRVIAFDTRGHGESPVPDGPYTIAQLGSDVLALMDRLAIERADYVGLSIGGMVGQWVAIHAPQRIRRLVLLCTSPDTLQPEAFSQRAQTVLAAGATTPIVDGVLARWFTPGWAQANPESLDRFRAMFSAIDPVGYAGCCEAIAGHDVAAGLPGVTAPTLVVSAAQDEAIPASQGRRIAELVTGARFELLDPAAHIASVEQAQAVTALISEFLA